MARSEYLYISSQLASQRATTTTTSVIKPVSQSTSKPVNQPAMRPASPILRLAALATIGLVLALIDANNGQYYYYSTNSARWMTTSLSPLIKLAEAREYYYTRTRNDPNHLRISEEFKNPYVKEIKLQSRINGTKYDYYKSSMTMSHDELVFETIDKIFQHRLSPFYMHHYDNEEDKRQASDPRLVSQEACSRDLMYLLDKLPRRSSSRDPYTTTSTVASTSAHDDMDHLTPELEAFFDSYARQEAGLLMGNTYWVGAYEQCINRHVFELFKKPTSWITDSHEGQRQRQQPPAARRQQQQEEEHQEVISFKGRYCVSALRARSWDSIIKAKKVRSKNYFKSQRQINDYSKLFRLQVGICLPSSCDSTSLERHADEIKILTTNWLEQRYADYELVDLYCLPDAASPLRSWSSSARCFVFLLAAWLVVVMTATTMDFLDDHESITIKEQTDNYEAKSCGSKISGSKSRKFVAWFSLRANYNKLMRVNEEHDQKTRHSKKPSSSKEKKEADASANNSDPETTSDCQQRQQARQLGLTKRQRKQQERRQQRQQQQQQQQPQPSGQASIEERRPVGNEQPTASLKINLRFLNAFKVLVMFWIVNGHIMLLMIQTAKNILNSDALLNGLMHFLIGATFGVDLFFTMTGFLTSYLIFNSGHAYKMRPATWIYLSFHRYWRLAPLYLLTFWFSRSVLQLLGSGPLWDYGTSSLTFRGLCNHESWWYPLTLTSNLHGLFEECMITSWYISCDMQFWLISPLYIHLLAKSPLNGWLAALSTILMSSKVRYDAILEEPAARHDELAQPRADIFMRVSHDLPALYTHPHYRIAAYIVGLLAGHYVYMIKSGKWISPIAAGCPDEIHVEGVKNKKFIIAQTADATTTTGQSAQTSPHTRTTNNCGPPSASITKAQRDSENLGKARRNLLAYTGLALFFCMSFASYLLANYYPASLLGYAKPISALAYAAGHLLMSTGASLIIIAMCFGQWSSIVKFLSHPTWTRLSKINYALLLLQCEAIYYQIFRYDQVPVAGTKELINILFNLLVTLYPLAFAVTLLFEYPLANMEKLLSLK